MKERTFYTINLDIKRIIILLCLLILIAALIFYGGMSIGKKQSVVQEVKTSMDSSLEGNKANPNEKAPIKMEDEIVKHVTKSSPKDNSEIIDLTNKNSSNEDDITVLDDKEVLNDDVVPPNKKKVSKHYSRHSSKSKYTIQFGAFSSKAKANFLKEKIAQIDPKINPYIQRNGRLYTVRAGMTNNKSELKRMIQVLEPELKEKAIIVRVPKSSTYQK